MASMAETGRRPFSESGVMTVLRKEMQAQRRQMRLGWRLLLWVAFAVALFVWVLTLTFSGGNFSSSPFSLFAYGGRSLLHLLLIAHVLPAAAGAIARERETGALDLLLLTPLRGAEILGGKLLAAVLPSLMMLGVGMVAILVLRALLREEPVFAALPGMQVMLATACLIGAIGVFVSTLVPTTARAIGISIILLLFSAWVISIFGQLLISLVMGTVMTYLIDRISARMGWRSMSMPFRYALMALLTLAWVTVALVMLMIHGPLPFAPISIVLTSLAPLILSALLFLAAVKRLNRMRGIG